MLAHPEFYHTTHSVGGHLEILAKYSGTCWSIWSSPHHRPARGARRARAARRCWTWVAVAAANGQRPLLPPTAQFRDLARPRTPPTSTRRTRRTHPPRRAAPRGVRRRDAGPRWLSRSPWNVRFSAAVAACRLPVAGRRSSFFGTPARRATCALSLRVELTPRARPSVARRETTQRRGAWRAGLALGDLGLFGCLGRARAPSLIFFDTSTPASQPASRHGRNDADGAPQTRAHASARERNESARERTRMDQDGPEWNTPGGGVGSRLGGVLHGEKSACGFVSLI